MALITETSTGRSLLVGDSVQEKEVKKQEQREHSMEERLHYRPKNHERAQIKLSEKDINKLRNLYSSVVVKDFGDMYHLTEQERKEKNRLYEVQKSLQEVKTKYNRLDRFVENYRLVLQAVKEIGKTNIVMDEDTFLKKALSGKIKINGIIFPKLIMPKKKRKEINWEVVSEYILDPRLDPQDLVAKKRPDVDWDTMPENPEEEMLRLFGTTYKKYVKNIKSKNEPVDFEDDEYIEEHNIIKPMSRLDLLRLMKDNKDFGSQLKEMFIKFRKFSAMERALNSDEVGGYTSYYSSAEDDMNEIRTRDEERNLLRKTKSNVGLFTGSFMDDTAISKFEYESDEYLKKKIKVKFGPGYRSSGDRVSIAEFEQETIREHLEEDGWDVRSLYNITKEEKRVKKKVKKDAKRIEKIKKALTQSEERRGKKTKLVGFEMKRVKEDINSSKKKKSKKGKKLSKKAKKKMKQEAIFNTAYSNYEDYEEAMLNFDD